MSCGKLSRITVPSLLGVIPRSLFWIAFSIALIEFWSYGEITSNRGSGTLNPASCCIGTVLP